MTCPPVLIVAFNRPDATRRVLETVRTARPAQVFLAVDGPRSRRPEDEERVNEVRGLADRLDWGCEVKTLFQPANLGCKIAVSRAINWFFNGVDAGVVLEDDCVAHSSFFPFVAELLERYRDDERVVMISGDNFQCGRQRTAYSYYFSRYAHNWGWASWRRAWRLYDHSMALWPELKEGGWLMDVLGDPIAADYWERIFDATHGERNNSWAYRWMFATWAHGGLTALPRGNLVSNVGFDEFATHTRNGGDPFSALPVAEMKFPLRHPSFLIRDEQADAITQHTVFRSPPRWRIAAGRMYRRWFRSKT